MSFAKHCHLILAYVFEELVYVVPFISCFTVTPRFCKVMEFHIVLAFASKRICHRCTWGFACTYYESYLFSVLLNNPDQVIFFWTWGKRILRTLSTNITVYLILSFLNSGLLIFEDFKSNSLFLQISSKDEDFLDLSVDVEQNTSITHCLR